MWIKPKYVPNNRKFIKVPPELANKLNGKCNIIFGGRTARVKVRCSNELEFYENSSFDTPIIIELSDKLKEELLIPETLIYQIKIEKNDLTIGPVIGLLLGVHNHIYSPRHMSKYSDRFGIYDKVGGLIYAFSPKSVDLEKEVAYGLYYNITNSKWEYGTFPLPSVIYRRDFHQSPEVIDKLLSVTNGRLFNSHRFTKFELYEFVSQDKELATSLPPTEISHSYDQIKSFIDRHSKVILKPIDLSRGRGICFIEMIGASYKVTDYRSKYLSEIILEGSEDLEQFFCNNQDFYNKYLIQKYIQLARINDSLFDIRVVMQKESKINWKCSGIECRVSLPNGHITNISRGGYALELHEALRLVYQSKADIELLTRKIHQYCLKLCTHMDKMGKHFAEFGLDIALDEDKNLWLIEVNVLPSFKGIKEMDYETYLSIRYSPLLYALSLLGFNEEPGGE